MPKRKQRKTCLLLRTSPRRTARTLTGREPEAHRRLLHGDRATVHTCTAFWGPLTHRRTSGTSAHEGLVSP